MTQKDVSLELEALREKLLFVEEAFFSLVGEGGMTREKARGLGNIIADLADDTRDIFIKLYGEESAGESREPLPPQQSKRPVLTLAPKTKDNSES